MLCPWLFVEDYYDKYLDVKFKHCLWNHCWPKSYFLVQYFCVRTNGANNFVAKIWLYIYLIYCFPSNFKKNSSAPISGVFSGIIFPNHPQPLPWHFNTIDMLSSCLCVHSLHRFLINCDVKYFWSPLNTKFWSCWSHIISIENAC
jgi:hypothetical protein